VKNWKYLAIGLVVLVYILSFLNRPTPVKAVTTGCASGSPTSGSYTVTVCLMNPANGGLLSGDQTVTAMVSVSGTNPGVQRVVFTLNGAYVLTDYGSPFSFTLSTVKWVDATYQLSAYALMRDGYASPQGFISVTFNNGITTPPLNNNQFQPSTGNPPSGGQPFLVAAAGDGASGQSTSSQVVNLISSLKPNLFLYLGDVYEKGSSTEFYNWYGVSTNFGSLRAITDPTIGNHEYENGVAPGYFDYWNNIPNYYSFNAGGWHLVSLNSNSAYIGVGTSSPQYQWLQQDLNADSLPCTIVFYHAPLFNIGSEGAKTSMSSIWALLAQHGVSIVLNGHDHDYQRWMPLDGNGNPSPTGVTEFVAGGGGHGIQTFTSTDSRVAYSNDSNPAAFGALLLQLSSTSANFSYHSVNGSILDSGTIPCEGANSTASPTPTPTLGSTPTPAPTSTPTFTNTPAATNTPTATSTPTPTIAVTNTPLPTNTATPTLAATNTPTLTFTPTNTPLATNTPTATSSGGQTFTFTPIADAYVDSSQPASNFGTGTTIRVDGSPIVNSYIKFSVSGLSGTVTKVSLMIFANSSGSLGIKANSVADTSWGETSLTYNTAPSLGSVLASSAAFTSGTWVTLDVTGYITADGTYSFGITDPSSTAIGLASRESGTNAEKLIIVTQ